MAGIEVITQSPFGGAPVEKVLLRMSPTKALIVASRIRDMDPEVYEQVRQVIDVARADQQAPDGATP